MVGDAAFASTIAASASRAQAVAAREDDTILLLVALVFFRPGTLVVEVGPPRVPLRHADDQARAAVAAIGLTASSSTSRVLRRR